MRVTVLVAAYNAADCLPRCLDSLTSQTHADVEIIVIDDASTDGTAAVAAGYQNVRLLRLSENCGQAVARNEGLKLATGQLVTMVDADDWLAADALQRAAEAMTDDVDSVVLRLVKVYPDGREEEWPMPASLDAEGGVVSGHEAFRLSLDWRLHGLYVARRELYDRYPFDTATRLYSDDNTTRLHYFASRKVALCSGTYYYRQHPGSMTGRHTILRFDYMEANLSMRLWLDRLGASRDDIMYYEAHRWLNYIGMRWYQWQHRFPADEVNPRLERIYHTFNPADIPMSARRKFGYRHCGGYRLFALQERVYFALRSLFYNEWRAMSSWFCSA